MRDSPSSGVVGRTNEVSRPSGRTRPSDRASFPLVGDLVDLDRGEVFLRAVVEPLAAATDGGQELVEVALERGEDPVGPVLHLEASLARLTACLVDDLLRLALGELDDLRLRRLPHRLLARLLEEPVLLALGLGEHLLALLDDPARLLDLL